MKEIKKTGFSLTRLSLYIVLLATVFSCKKASEYYNQFDLPTASVAEFGPGTVGGTPGSYIGSYFIKSTNDPYLLPVGFTGFADADRVINFTVTSKTAVAGVQYVTPSPVTVKAGQALDTLRLKGIFAGYPAGRRDTVTIKLKGYPTVNNTDSFRVVIQPYCDVIPANLAGNYTKSYDIQTGQPTYGPYGTSVSNYTALTPTTATIKITNFWDVGTSVTVTLDWTDPANFKTTIPAQFLYTDPTYGAATITGVGNGTFSSCDNTFSFSYKVTVAAGSFGNFTTTIAR